MTIRELDAVVLERDVAEHGLRRGDVGAVVAILASDVFEVEFVRTSGATHALVQLTVADVRHLADGDLPAVRPT